MRLFTAALAVPIFLAAACTTSPAVQIDYTDFVKLGGVTYQAEWTSPVHPIQDAELGPVYGKVKVKLEGSQDPKHQLQDGDSAFLAPGTQVYRVTGYQSTFRLAARHDGRLTLYEADTNPRAKVGADLLDLANKVLYIGVNSESDGHTELAAIKDPNAVRALVDLVEKSPVDQSNQHGSGPQYFVDFHMLDDTEVIRSYWPGFGELARGIRVPIAFGVAIASAIQSVSAGGAPTPTA